MERELTCIICPRGCSLRVATEGDSVTVTGNACARGEKYGIEESTHPTRTVTSIIRVANRKDTMVSVKTAQPIPKEKIFELIEIIQKKDVMAPIEIGAIICDNVFGTSVIATKQVK